MLNGTAVSPTKLELRLLTLIRKTFEQPSLLEPSDLDPIREIVGDGALDYALVIGSFHFINRIADLLDVSPEGFPSPLRRFEFLRGLYVRLASTMMAKMDLANRDYLVSYEEAVSKLAPFIENPLRKGLDNGLAPLKSQPRLVENLQLAMEERDKRSTLGRETLAKVHRTVEAALPVSREEAEGFHALSEDIVEAFAFIGTRYAYRATKATIDALRREACSDLGILDLAIAVAEANQWARMYRLLGFDKELFYVSS